MDALCPALASAAAGMPPTLHAQCAHVCVCVCVCAQGQLEVLSLSIAELGGGEGGAMETQPLQDLLRALDGLPLLRLIYFEVGGELLGWLVT